MRNFLLSLLLGSFCLVPAQTRAAVPTKTDAAAQAAQDEIVRRQEAQLSARSLIAQGQNLAANGRYEDAVAKFDQALTLLPRAKATESDRAKALRGISDAYTRLADSAYQAGDAAKSRQMADKALGYDPNNSAARSTIAKLAKSEGKPATVPSVGGEAHPEQSPEFLAKKEQIKKLFREGKLLLNSGQLDEAERRFKQVLLIDPYNEDAHVLIGQVNKQRLDVAQTGADLTRTRRLWEVTDAWIPPLGREVQVPKPGEGAGPIGMSAARQAELTKKLNTIIIPDINFRDAVVTDVLRFLSDESRRLDSVDHSGVNIVLQLGEGGATTPAAAPTPAPGATGPTPAATTESAGETGTRKITLILKNIPLIEALRFVTSIANLKFRVETSAVLVLPKDYPETDMITRTYPVESGAVHEVLTAPTTAAPARTGGAQFTAMGEGGQTVEKQDLRQFFLDAGVPFPTGSSLAYNERTSTIIVRNTPENIEIFERVLAALNVVPKQVEIEAKFVEIAQNDLDELGFQWFVGPHSEGQYIFNAGSIAGGVGDLTTGLRDSSAISGNRVDDLLKTAATVTSPEVASISGILTDPQFQVVIKALSQKKSSDVLYAPKITTISGNTAQMKVVREFIYPTEYSLPQVAQNAVTPAIPQAFKTREIGQLLNVTPTVGADGYTINLTIQPEVSDFEGFLDYSPGDSVSTFFGTGAQSNLVFVTTVHNVVVQPLFNSRNLRTGVVIWDGQTVVLGGLIREEIQMIDDKVPVLGDIPFIGRLFRSKVTTRNKKNLLIFVTARLVDPSGNLIHRPALASAEYR